jgi:hypothetical protein
VPEYRLGGTDILLTPQRTCSRSSMQMRGWILMPITRRRCRRTSLRFSDARVRFSLLTGRARNCALRETKRH